MTPLEALDIVLKAALDSTDDERPLERERIVEAVEQVRDFMAEGAPRCACCDSSKEHVEMMALVAGIADPICCGGH